MGSSYFGEPNMRSEHSVTTTTTTRKSKKSGQSDKPKQPQRGLGVAQLEKIRLHSQMGGCTSYNHQLIHPSQNHLHSPSYPPSTFTQEDLRTQGAGYSSSSFSYSSSTSSSTASYGFNPSYVMGVADYERGNIRYNNNDSQPSNPASWGNANGLLEIPPYVQPAMTRHLFNMHAEDPQAEKVKNRRSRLLGSSSQSSEANDAAQEVDLELRLSL